MMRSCVAVLLSLLYCGCQKYEWEDVPAEGQSAVVYPIGHGRGTQQYPLTVADVQAGKAVDGQTCWVMGYAVGSTNRSMSNASFSVPTQWAQNILLSDDSLCTDATACVAVQLTTQKMKNTFSLVSRPDMHARFVVLCGVAGTYLSQRGIRQASDGYWLPAFDLSRVNEPPTPWDEFESEY